MYIVFDTETTGLPRNWKAPITDLNNWPRLVQLAWYVYDEDGVELSAADYIVRPDGFVVPPEVSRIHGITHDDAMAKGKPITEVLELFASDVARAEALVAHNMSFDEAIVRSEMLRAGMEDIVAAKEKLCTKELATEFCAIEGQYGYKWPKLPELYNKLFPEPFAETHNARADAFGTAKCFWELKKRGVIK